MPTASHSNQALAAKFRLRTLARGAPAPGIGRREVGLRRV